MADRPKVQIIRTEDTVSVWLNGKEVTVYTGHVNRLDLVEKTARELARALGADVEDTDEPDRRPYRYYVTYTVLRTDWKGAFAGIIGAGAGQIHSGMWFDLDKEIEGPADTWALADRIAATFSYPVIVKILAFDNTDGPC